MRNNAKGQKTLTKCSELSPGPQNILWDKTHHCIVGYEQHMT